MMMNKGRQPCVLAASRLSVLKAVQQSPPQAPLGLPRTFMSPTRIMIFRPRLMATSQHFGSSFSSTSTAIMCRRRSTTITCRSGSSTAATATAAELCEVEKIAGQVGVRLTPNELSLLRKKLDLNGDGAVTRAEIERVGQEALQKTTTRSLCLSVVCDADNPLDKFGVRIINFFDYTGTALFAVVGTLVAGDSGMNIVGCSLVGSAAALGGGSLNAMMYGGASPLLGKPGVRWVANPSYLVVAMVACVVTFFAWPYYCESQADHYLENVIGIENLDQNGGIGRDAFLKTWVRDADFRKTIRDALPRVKPNNDNDGRDVDIDYANEGDGLLYFSHIDSDESGDIDHEELQELVQHRFYNGWETYLLDTLGLSSLSIAAVSMSIKLGLHPIVAATSGVTVCFGGILRDLLCGRDLAIGGQSYAFTTGSSSAMYVFLRELTIRRILILPLALRTFMSAGTCVALRGWEYYKGEPFLRPMHRRHLSN